MLQLEDQNRDRFKDRRWRYADEQKDERVAGGKQEKANGRG